MVKEDKSPKAEPINNIDNTESKYSSRLTVSDSTKNLICNGCRKEFLIHHPEFEGMKLTENFIVRQIAEHYLRSP